MINFTNEDIKSKSAEWSLNEDVKLINKLKSLDQLLSNSTKEILDNVNKTDYNVSNEAILIKNLINDFYLVGHKQFTENRVEEENETKLFKSTETEKSFERSFDGDNLIDQQMRSTLDNSLKFVREKLNLLNESVQQDQLDHDEQIEKLIKLNSYHQKKLPPIVNSDEFMNEIYRMVKEESRKVAKKSSSLNSSKSTDNSIDSKSNTETSSIISELEKISINDKILEINENNFIEHLSTAPQSSTSSKDARIQTDLARNLKSSLSTNLDQSQMYKQDKIDVLNENVNSVREQLDAIFSKASEAAKNRNLFEDDSDEELFQAASQSQKRTKDLFKSDSEESIDFNISKKSDLFDSNIRSINKSKNENQQILNENKQSSNESKQILDEKKATLNNLFDSDSDDELFSIKVRKSVLKESNEIKNKDSKLDKESIQEPIKESIKEPIKELKKEPIKELKKEPVKELKKELSKELSKELNKELIKEPIEGKIFQTESSSSSEESLDSDDKMSDKKNEFKNKLEELFSKKRKPSVGFIKVNRNKSDSEFEADEKRQEDTATSSESISTNKTTTNQISPKNEFDALTSVDLNKINTVTLNNDLVKTRIKPVNRKRPTIKSSNKKPNQSNQPIEPIKSINKEILSAAKPETSSVKKEDDKLDKKETGKEVTNKMIEEKLKDEPKYTAEDNAIDKNVNLKNVSQQDATKNEIAKKKPLLFSDSDDEQDELFRQTKKPEKTQHLKESLNKKLANLFPDSDDDDAELFAASKSASQNKNAKYESDDKKKARLSKLFDTSDDSSDDGLFKK